MNLFYDLPLEIQDKILINIKYENKEKYYKKCKNWLNKHILEIVECYAPEDYLSLSELCTKQCMNTLYNFYLIECNTKENYKKVLLELNEFF